MARILIVDDEEEMRRVVAATLRGAGHETEVAEDGAAALRAAYRLQPQVVLMDVMMPGMSGVELCRRLREISEVGIIMLTGLGAEKDIVRGLEAGADDYLTKPFQAGELIARVEALLRRTGRSATQPATLISVRDLTIDLARHQVTVRGEPVALSPTEFRLLAYLARSRDRITPHAVLLAEIWGPEYRDQLEYLRLYMRYLRQKIELDPAKPEYIKTMRGVGYYLDG